MIKRIKHQEIDEINDELLEENDKLRAEVHRLKGKLVKSMGHKMKDKQKYEFMADCEFDKQGRYSQACENCALEAVVLTQADQRPEYYTDVFTYCAACGVEIQWVLPVN
jgi:hypothetical protein